MVEFGWNFHSEPGFVISESRFCKRGELSGESWKKAMELDDVADTFSRIVTSYPGFGIVYDRKGTTIAITLDGARGSADYSSNDNWIGVKKMPDGSFNLCGTNELAVSIDPEQIEHSIVIGLSELITR